MRNPALFRAMIADPIMILRGRVNIEAIQKCSSASTRVLTTLHDPYERVPKNLVTLYLSFTNEIIRHYENIMRRVILLKLEEVSARFKAQMRSKDLKLERTQYDLNEPCNTQTHRLSRLGLKNKFS